MREAARAALIDLVTMPAEPVLAALLAKNKMKYRFGGDYVRQAALQRHVCQAWLQHRLHECWRDESAIVSVRRYPRTASA